MPGAHRGPGASAGKSARWLAVPVIAVLAIAGLVWYFSNVTDLKVSALLLATGVIQLTQSLARGERNNAWIGAVLVTTSAWEILGDVTHHPGGSLANLVVRVVLLVCLAIATVQMAKAFGLGKVVKAIRARFAGGAGGDGSAGSV
jgi:hypothetical protein